MLSLFYLYYTGAIVDAIGYNVGTTASENDQLRDAVQQMILENWPGKKYVHIIGDANDWQEFAEDGPHRTTLWSSAPWIAKRMEYINDSAWYQNGQRNNNLMPTWIEVDPGEPGETMTSRLPYFYTDLPYSDVDDDARPDAIVGRWPVRDLAHFDQLINKFARYNQQPYANGEFNLLAYTGDLDYVAGSGDGSRATQLVDEYIAALPAGQTVNRVYESDLATAKAWPYLAESVAAWNNYSPDLALIASSSSNRYNAGRFFDVDDGWGANFNLINNLSVVLGVTCGTADYVTTERNNYGTPTTPVSERFLQECSGGAVVWIGPTAGSWQYCNSIIARYITDEFYENPYVPMCESFRNAIREVIDNYSGNEAVKRQARSYVFLGDPMSFPRQQERPCDVQVSNFYIQPHRTACPRVTIKWITSEEVECDVELQVDGGDWEYLGRTTSNTAHAIVYEAKLGMSYWTRITPICTNAETYEPHWTIYDCNGQGGRNIQINMSIDRYVDGTLPGVTISFSNPSSMYVKMSVYDVRGQLLKRLVDAVQPAGSHSVVWLGKDETGRSQPSGVYFVLFEGGGERHTQKFILLK